MTAAIAVEGPAAPPRDNGELVFAEPWEGRAFGMAVTLCESGLLGWDRFQAALIGRIKAWEDDHPPGECYSYYGCWLGALEDVLADSGLVLADETTARTGELAGRPAGHDHD
ncbi:MAG: nitrile hydratase accessory protein [Pseudonocardia sp.]